MKNVIAKKRSSGFTLLELMIYTGILTSVGFVATAVFLSVSRSYLRNQARAEVTQNLRVVTQFIQQKIQQAARVRTVSGSLLELDMPDGTITKFRLSNGAILRQEGVGPEVAITSNKVTVTSLNFLLVTTFQTQVDPVNKWAWNGGAGTTTDGIAEGLGWVDFSPPLGRVRVPLGVGDFFGYAYFPSIDGYLSLNCVTTDSCASVIYKVSSDANGVLSGYAWNDTYGWFSFNCNDVGLPAGACADGGNYKVTINTSTGEFMGWAWSENVGWVSFNCANSEVNSCASVSYKVLAPKKLGRPVTGVQTSVTVAYRDQGNVLLRYSDAFTFTVVLAQPSAVTVTSITPASGSTGSTISSVSVSGSDFQDGATVRLTRSGYNDVFPSTAFTFSSPTSLINGAFNLTGVAVGKWNVVVSNPDGTSGICVACFTVNL